MPAGFAEAAEIGHSPRAEPSLHDAAIFRAFQSNLLSLISHELRTPLMGVLNALTLLDERDEGNPASEFSQTEMIAMARSNAQRLHRALMTLLDLAALESGTFHARLKELDLARVVRHRVSVHSRGFKDRGIPVKVVESGESPVLADAQKITRAVDLILEVMLARAAERSEVTFALAHSTVSISFTLAEGGEDAWQQAWMQGLAGFEGGVNSPTSAFAGVLQSERGFLTRSEEGLGSELLLVHQILRLHSGMFTARLDGAQVTLKLELPELSGEPGLQAVLTSRAYEVSHELGSVALVVVTVPPGMKTEEFSSRVKRNLFRSSDAAYLLPRSQEVALVLDDCKAEDAPRLLGRLEKALERKLQFGMAHCPSDTMDPARLLTLARERLP